MFQVTSARLYVWVGIVFAVNMAILATTRAALDTSRLPQFALWCGQFALLFWAFSRLSARHGNSRALARMAALFEGLFFLQLAWLNLRLLNHLTMMLPVPFRDDLLSS